MSVTPNTRRLAAVVAADIVGYSAMMSKDEAAALKYREEIKTIITTKYAERSGRLVNLAGDGFLPNLAVQSRLSKLPMKFRARLHIAIGQTRAIHALE